MTRSEAQAWFVQLLLEKVRQDQHPSATQMSMIEASIPPEMVSDYLEILMDKIADDQWPSIPMMQRIQRVAQTLPRTENGGR